MAESSPTLGWQSLCMPIPQDFQLNTFLQKLASEITEEDLQNLKSLLHGDGGLPKRTLSGITSAVDFFTILKEKMYLNRENLIFVQACLWNVGRRDLHRKCVEFAKSSEKILHFYCPKDTPENGYQFIKFHVAGGLNTFLRPQLEHVQRTVAQLMGCQPEYVIVAGIEPSNSIVVTLMVLVAYVDLLLCADKYELGLLKAVDVDKIITNKGIEIDVPCYGGYHASEIRNILKRQRDLETQLDKAQRSLLEIEKERRKLFQGSLTKIAPKAASGELGLDFTSLVSTPAKSLSVPNPQELSGNSGEQFPEQTDLGLTHRFPVPYSLEELLGLSGEQFPEQTDLGLTYRSQKSVDEGSDFEPPKIGHKYVQNDLGQFEVQMDFRSNPEEYDYEVRPRVSPGLLYTDEEFPLWVAMGKDHKRKPLEWKRPPEFADKPCLFSEGISRYDIDQGSIGTCWFLASVANIADKPKLLRRIIPRDSYPVDSPNYDGIFHCRFWRFGIWDDVFIDDYLPIIYRNQIYSAHSITDPNEMWVSLLEKAFARMYGSYTEMSGGVSSDSYMALTGGVPEVIDLRELNMEPDQLHTRVRNALYSNAAVTCGTPGTFVKKYGLLGSHEYTINGAVTAKGVRLFRLRNPWDKTEWIGPYSDGSREWQSIQGIIEGPNRDDGEFYISLKHFLYLFNTLTICNITPDFDSDGQSDSLNYCTCLYGQWQGEEAGGFQNRMKNPKFQFEIDEQSLDQNGTVPFVVQLIQRTKRRTAQTLGIRADLYQVLENASDDILVLQEEGIPSKNYTYTYSKHTQISFRFSLKPGKYVCIPSAMNEGQEREFMLRLFSAGPLGDVKKIDSNEVTIMTCDGEDAKSYDHKRCLTGQWRAGSNAGGQLANKTFHINPQIKIKSSDQRVKFQLMVDSKAPIGLMLFKLKGESVPVGIDWLYKHYRDAVRMTDGDDGPFIKGTSAPAVYSLEAGSYVCLLHMDQPDTERRFALVIRSQTPLYDIEPHQME